VEGTEAPAADPVEIGPLRAEECRAVAELHESFFGEGLGQGHSIAMLGADFLERAFYRPNLDNPYFFVDVARFRGELIAFSVYSSDHRRVFRYTIRHHFGALALATLRVAARSPLRTAQKLAGNLMFLSESLPPETREIPAWFLLLAVKAPYRTREFQERTGVWIAGAFKQRLQRVLLERGREEYWAAPATANPAAISFYERVRAERFAEGTVQGEHCVYYRIRTRD
jgi:hypothetical protein